jgi:hypothetical protein
MNLQIPNFAIENLQIKNLRFSPQIAQPPPPLPLKQQG